MFKEIANESPRAYISFLPAVKSGQPHFNSIRIDFDAV